MKESTENNDRTKSIEKTNQRSTWRFSRIAAKRIRFILPLALLTILTGVIVTQMISQQTMTTSALVETPGLGVYWDRNCTRKVNSIGWGTLSPGTIVRRNIYVRNEGSATQILTMTQGNWTPTTAAAYFTLTWNCSGHVLPQNAIVKALLRLTVLPNITGVTDFGFTVAVETVG